MFATRKYLRNELEIAKVEINRLKQDIKTIKNLEKKFTEDYINRIDSLNNAVASQNIEIKNLKLEIDNKNERIHLLTSKITELIDINADLSLRLEPKTNESKRDKPIR